MRELIFNENAGIIINSVTENRSDPSPNQILTISHTIYLDSQQETDIIVGTAILSIVLRSTTAKIKKPEYNSQIHSSSILFEIRNPIFLQQSQIKSYVCERTALSEQTPSNSIPEKLQLNVEVYERPTLYTLRYQLLAAENRIKNIVKVGGGRANAAYTYRRAKKIFRINKPEKNVPTATAKSY